MFFRASETSRVQGCCSPTGSCLKYSTSAGTKIGGSARSNIQVSRQNSVTDDFRRNKFRKLLREIKRGN